MSFVRAVQDYDAAAKRDIDAALRQDTALVSAALGVTRMSAACGQRPSTRSSPRSGGHDERPPGSVRREANGPLAH